MHEMVVVLVQVELWGLKRLLSLHSCVIFEALGFGGGGMHSQGTFNRFMTHASYCAQ